jgi:Protein of unknown function (DUF1878)
MDELLKKLERIQYHQRLMINMLTYSNEPFTKLIILNDLSEEEVQEFHELCEILNKKMEEQRAEGFVYFHPLLDEFTKQLNSKLKVKETVEACLQQKMYIDLMEQFKKLLSC